MRQGAKFPVMHLFPRKTNKTECGIWGIMTNQIEDVTCPDCLTRYRSHQAEEVKTREHSSMELSSHPKETNDGHQLEFSGSTVPNYAAGLANPV